MFLELVKSLLTWDGYNINETYYLFKLVLTEMLRDRLKCIHQTAFFKYIFKDVCVSLGTGYDQKRSHSFTAMITQVEFD